jgi:TRAP-type C4-dicarboxylate transport system permease small subunit
VKTLKLLKALDKHFETYFLIATLVFMVVIISVQVFLRTFFHYSLTWAEELSRYIMLYQIWVGASLAVKEDAHLRITSVKDSLSPSGQVKLEIFVIVLWTVFVAFLTIKSGQLVDILLNRGQVSPAMQIPMAYAYASVPFGCGLMVIRLCQKLFHEVKKLESLEV